MKKKVVKKRKLSTYSVWILSYLFVFLVPLLFGITIYIVALHNVKNLVDMTQRETMDSVVNLSDQTLESVQESAYALVNTALVKNLSVVSGEYRIEHYNDMATLQNSLYNLRVNNTYIDEIYLYFTQTDYLLSSYSYSKSNIYGFLIQSGIGYDEFQEITKGVHYKELRIMDSYAGKRMYLINSELPFSVNEERPKAVLLVQFNTDAIREMIQLDTASTCIVDSKGMYLSSNDEKLTPELLDFAMSKETGTQITKQQYVRTVSSEKFDLMYLNALPKKIYFQGVERLRILMAVYLLLCIIGGVIISVAMARRQYNPVREILDTVQKVDSSPEERDDMERIKHSIEQLLSEKETFRQRLESQKRALRSTVMYNLVKGRHLGRYILEGIPYSHGEFHYEGGYLLAFDVEDASKAFFEEHDDIEDELLDLVFYVVENIAEELLAERYTAFVSEADGVLLCLVNVPEDEKEQILVELSQLAVQIIDYLQSKFAVALSANISSYHPNWTGIEKCYYDIQDIMDYRSVNSDQKALLQYDELETFWKNQDSDMGELSNPPVSEPVLDFSEIRETYEGNPANRTDNKTTANDIVIRVQAYIQENYKDKDLSVGMLADEFGISLSYLSQIFKRATQTGLLEYIHLKRIEEAKKLLLDGMSVQDVAEEVGYYNTRPLIRMFKRMENMTPTEYKEAGIRKRNEE